MSKTLYMLIFQYFFLVHLILKSCAIVETKIYCIDFPFLLILVKRDLSGNGGNMSIFRTSTETNDGYELLLRDLEQTTDDLKDAYNNLGNVVEPDLIDYYIYQVKAVSMRYKFLLDCVKKIEDPYAKNPL